MNNILFISAFALIFTIICIPKAHACTEVREVHTVKENSSEEDIFEFAEFVKLHYKDEFEVSPELDGVDFFASSLSEDKCDRGFQIIMDNDKNIIIDSTSLIIGQSSSYKNCSEILRKVVTHFQSHKKLPAAKQVKVTCEKRL